MSNYNRGWINHMGDTLSLELLYFQSTVNGRTIINANYITRNFVPRPISTSPLSCNHCEHFEQKMDWLKLGDSWQHKQVPGGGGKASILPLRYNLQLPQIAVFESVKLLIKLLHPSTFLWHGIEFWGGGKLRRIIYRQPGAVFVKFLFSLNCKHTHHIWII